jgi:quinol monooxygenase YgiN
MIYSANEIREFNQNKELYSSSTSKSSFAFMEEWKDAAYFS